MDKRSRSVGLVTTVEQMEALASPVRFQIHLAMEMLGVCSVNELAERMDREPETLYYHLRLLERVGIVVRAGSRAAAGREEALYRLMGRRLRIDPRQRSPRFLRAMARSCGALLRYAERTFVRSLRRPAFLRGGSTRTRRMEQVVVRLPEPALAELNERLDELQDFLSAADERDADAVYAVTVCVAPVGTR